MARNVLILAGNVAAALGAGRPEPFSYKTLGHPPVLEMHAASGADTAAQATVLR